MPENKVFTYGTHYWRPPTPPREDHYHHLRKIKNDLQFDIIRLRLLWNWHHRGVDEFVFDEVHEIFDVCDTINLNVLIEVSLENALRGCKIPVHPGAKRYYDEHGVKVK